MTEGRQPRPAPDPEPAATATAACVPAPSAPAGRDTSTAGQGTAPAGPGTLDWFPADGRPDLLAAPVASAVRSLSDVSEVWVAEIDADLADTAAFGAAYAVPMALSANCVIVAGRRGELTRYAACVVLATTRADVNGVVRRRLEARKASFAAMDDATALSGMEYGGITPVGLPADWPVLIDAAVATAGVVVIGSGLRRSKLAVDGAALGALPGAEIVEGLAR